MIYFSHYKAWRLEPFKGVFWPWQQLVLTQQHQWNKGAGSGLRRLLMRKISTLQNVHRHLHSTRTKHVLKGPKMMWRKPTQRVGPSGRTQKIIIRIELDVFSQVTSILHHLSRSIEDGSLSGTNSPFIMIKSTLESKWEKCWKSYSGKTFISWSWGNFLHCLDPTGLLC